MVQPRHAQSQRCGASPSATFLGPRIGLRPHGIDTQSQQPKFAWWSTRWQELQGWPRPAALVKTLCDAIADARSVCV